MYAGGSSTVRLPNSDARWMKPVIRDAPPRGPEAAAEAEAVPSEELEKVLRAPETSDTAWLRAFRSYTVKNLVAERSGQPTGPGEE